MKRNISFIFVILILAASAFAISGPAISPGCIPMDCKPVNATIGSILNFEVRVYNFDNFDRKFSVFAGKDLINATKLSPTYFELKPRKSGECTSENGCEAINITINLKGVKEGIYSTEIVAQSSLGQGGDLEVIQQVASTIVLNVKEKPTLFNRIKGFIAAKLAKADGALARFYENNKWLNYLAILILVLLAFWLGSEFRRFRLRTKDLWEIDAFKSGKFFVYLILNCTKEKIVSCDVFEEKENLIGVLKEQFKNEIPNKIVINKTKECDEIFEKLLKRNRVMVAYSKVKAKTIDDLIAKKLKDVKDLTEAQEELNDHVKALNKERIKSLIKKQREKHEKKT